MGEDVTFQLDDLGARLEAELVREVTSQALVGPQRVGLTTRPVQASHQLRPETFTQRVLGHQRLELAHQLGVATLEEVRLHPLLGGHQPQAVEPLGLHAHRSPSAVSA